MRFQLSQKKKNLFKNTIMLYILQFSTYLFSFITVPYQTRVLGPVIYGRIGVATAIMVYFQLFIDFGFLLSGTELVAKHRQDKRYLSTILTSITISKIILTIISFCILLTLGSIVQKWKEDFSLYFLFLLSAAINSFLPDYLYRGMENMTIITIRTVCVKMFFSIMIFFALKNPGDYYAIPLLNIIGNFVALIWAYSDLKIRFNIVFIKVKLGDIWNSLKKSSVFFYSRIASAIYTGTNTLLLGWFLTGSSMVGLYTSADKLIVTAQSAMSPISDSLYPYMIKNRDFRLIKKTLTFIMPIIIIGCAIIGIWANSFCAFLFGEDFKEAGSILRILLPIVVMTLPNYILGFPTLSPVGLSKYANYSVMFSSCIHIIQIIIFCSCFI